MTFTQKEVILNIGDMVSFRGYTKDGFERLTGELKGVVPADKLTIRVVVNEFLMVTIAAIEVDHVNDISILDRSKINFRVSM